jgi:hypothetical protein
LLPPTRIIVWVAALAVVAIPPAPGLEHGGPNGEPAIDALPSWPGDSRIRGGHDEKAYPRMRLMLGVIGWGVGERTAEHRHDIVPAGGDLCRLEHFHPDCAGCKRSNSLFARMTDAL